MIKHALVSLSVLTLLGCSSAPPAPDFDTAAMDALLLEAVENGDVIGVQALVFDEGQVVYRNQFGLADRERNVPVADDTVYRVYSMTKPMTSALIMALVHEGKIALDDPAAKYIPQLAQMKVVSIGEDGTPSYAEQARPMTVEDLLLHRAGMAYGIFGGNPIEDAWGAADLFALDQPMSATMDKLAMLPLLGQPGEQWFYSFSIDVLGQIAEVVEGAPLGDLFEARFFEPLGMTETGFYVTADQKPRFASNYMQGQDGSFTLADDAQTSDFTVENAMQSGGGGLVSTTDDWLKFARMLLNEGEYKGTRVLAAETVRLMKTDHLGATPSLLPWVGEGSGAGFGYGGSVQLSENAETGRYPGQFGWGGAARTNFWIDPENDAIGIIMLQMFSGPEDPPLHDAFQALTLEQTRDDRP